MFIWTYLITLGDFRTNYLKYILFYLLKLWSLMQGLTNQTGWFFQQEKKTRSLWWFWSNRHFKTLDWNWWWKNTLHIFIPNERMLPRCTWLGRVQPYNSVFTDSSHSWLRILITFFGFKKWFSIDSKLMFWGYGKIPNLLTLRFKNKY